MRYSKPLASSECLEMGDAMECRERKGVDRLEGEGNNLRMKNKIGSVLLPVRHF